VADRNHQLLLILRSMKIKLYLLAFFCFFHFNQLVFAENNPPPMPLPDGVIAPDFTLTDINGNSHTLYDYLDAGIDVILDFGATWCGPCWNYHQTHILRDIYNASEAMVFMIEVDGSTPTSCIYGNCGNTIGNWTIGTPFPIINLEGSGLSVAGDYAISYVPTLYGISAYNKKAYEIGQASRATWQTWLLQSFQMKETAPPVVANVACAGENNGSIDVTITGGYINRSFRWNNNRTTEDLSDLAPGDYYPTVTDAHNYSIELGPYTVEGPSNPLEPIAELILPADCANQATGVISVNGFGGTPGYSFSWSTGAGGPTISGLLAGTYTVTVTDAEGCTGTDSYQVSAPPVLELFVDTQNESCGEGNGQLSLLADGGTPGYLYNVGWGNSPAETYDNLSAGTYYITVTDANGCTAIDVVEIENTPAPTADGGGDTEISCDETETTLDGSGSSDGTTFTYLWTTTNGNIVTGDSTLMPVVDTAGTYVLLITNTQNGCASTDTVEVSEVDDQTLADSGADKTLDCANSSIRLDGSDSSNDTLSTYTYAWTGPAGHILEGDSSLMPLVDTVGQYILEVTNTLTGCIALDTVNVGEDLVSPDAEAGPEATITCIVNSLNLDGSASSSDTSNIFDYQWTSPNGNIVSGDTTLNPLVNTPGYYIIEVTNTQNGCIAVDSVFIAEDTTEPDADAGPTAQLDCNNNSVTLSGSSSSANNVSYLWSTNTGNIISGANSPNPTVDQAGTYLLTVTNVDNGCQNTAEVSISQDVEAPVADAGPAGQLDCINTNIMLNGSSSSGANTSYSWSTTTGNIISGANSPNPTVDQAGTYLLTVTNADNGCQSTASVDISQDIEMPVADAGPAGQLDCTINQLTLNGSQSSTGGNYSYLWISTDGNIISGDGTLNPIIDQPGTYTLDVSNLNNGCSSSSSVTIFQDTETPTAIIAQPQELNCTVQEVTLDGTGSSVGSQFSYLWSTNNGSIISGGNSLGATVGAAGNYTLLIQNNQNGCTSSINVNVEEAPVLEASLMDATDNLCYGETNGTATVQVTGGSGNYFYNWSNGNVTATANDLAAGIYIVSVSDEGGCLTSVEVNITEPALLIAQAVSTDETASGAADGTASVTPSGGTPPFSYAWSNGGTTQTINNLSPDNYTVIVTDQHGCMTEAIVTVSSFNCVLSSNTSATNLTCYGANDGTAGINIVGGEGPFNYQWSNGAQTQMLDNLSAGVYTVTVTDANNCPVTANITIEEPEAINVSVLNQTDVNCFGETNGSIALNAIGGSGALSYQWTNGATGSQANNLPAGAYRIIISDENNCETSIELEINEPSLLEVSQNSTAETALGAGDGTASVSPVGGTPPYSYLWNTNATTSSITNLGPGTYTVVITDDNGCAQTETIIIQSFDCSSFSAEIETTNLSCFDSVDGIAAPILNGGIAPFQYEWSNGSNLSSLNDLSAGTYTLTITDGGNCPSILSFTIERPLPIELEEVNLQHLDCFGSSTGSIQVLASGGTGNLNYTWPSGNSGQTESNLTAGVYELEIMDENGCPFRQAFELEQPLALQTSLVNQTNVQCANDLTGEATVQVEGGVMPYTYLWSNGNTNATANQLSAGTHQLVVTDANGCETTFEVDIEADDQTAPVALAQDITVALDANGLADILPAQVDNGSSDNCGPVSFELNQNSFGCDNLGANSVVLTVIDGAGNRTDISATVNVIDNLPPQITNCPADIETNDCGGQVTYALPEATDNCELFAPLLVSGLGSGAIFPIGTSEEVYRFTDASGNEVSCSFFITVTNTLEAEIAADEEVCFGAADASATINASGGNPAYEYLWSDGQTTATATGLSAGTYTFTLTDANGCTYQDQISITELPELFLTIDEVIDEVGANNMGSIDITVSGGTPPYQYFWSKGALFISNDEDLSGLSAGIYQVEVVDANGCVIASETLEVGNLTAAIDLELDRQLEVFPNPTTGVISLALQQLQTEEVRIEIYDAVGHRLLLDTFSGNQLNKQLDLSNQPAGLYWIKVSVGERIASRRIVVQR